MGHAVLDRPIFLVGHARAGSTALALAINAHPEVGPKHPPLDRPGALQQGLDALLGYDDHLSYAERVEQKDVWFDWLPGRDVFTHMGAELAVAPDALDAEGASALREALTADFSERRYFSKAPTNSFRLDLLRELFPGLKVLMLVRDGREVVASWGRRPYGFGQRVTWGRFRRSRFDEAEAIEVFAQKWAETIDALERYRNDAPCMIVDHADLATHWDALAPRIFDYLELPLRPELRALRFSGHATSWQEGVSPALHDRLAELTREGNEWIAERSLRLDD